MSSSSYSSLEDEDFNHIRQLQEGSEGSVKRIKMIVQKNSHKILGEQHSPSEMTAIKRQLEVNCWSKGDLDTTQGKKLLVIVDGTQTSVRAIKTAIAKSDPSDHLCVVMAYKKGQFEDYTKAEREILRHRVWLSASKLTKAYESDLMLSRRSYTLAFVGAEHSTKRMLVKLAKQWKVHAMVVSKDYRKKDPKTIFSTSLTSFFAKRYPCEMIIV
eukprot:TRINITY_DN22604_c0_g1_i1.p1 TRINITY_DN22604_c0_g1~~TRINITY_DN22604_c0_g1_i1.p1  ORF type:complete len:214 (+),score=42.28 TRINITY_DN22604_c0_g1_i1:113-754(+)